MIYIASDHGGYKLKEQIKKYLDTKKIEYQDFGTNSTEMVDYPIYVKKAIDALLKKKNSKALLFCGSGVGNCIYANRFKKVYAVNAKSVEIAKVAREHNNVNCLCLGGRFLSLAKTKKIVDVFLNTEYLGGHYNKRIKLIDA